MHQGKKLLRYNEMEGGYSYNNLMNFSFCSPEFEIPPFPTIMHKIVLSNQINTLRRR